jgi:phenylpyruvate tautomerase PptA (4-oxalocrotonate tautomerase family)
MMLVELFAPRGTLTGRRRREVVERLCTELLHEEGVPPAVAEASRTATHVVVHEPATWMVGGRPAEGPRFVVRVSVPGAWRAEISARVIARVTQVLVGAFDDEHAVVWVHVIGVPEGGMGAFGRVMRSTDIVKLLTASFRGVAAA